VPNRLANETSPYLLQHAENPVDWYPWGEEAFAHAWGDVGIRLRLQRGKGRVVSREMLFNECWDMQYLPNSRTIDQHISKLRKRVELDANNPTLITTVHGVGYRIE